MLALSPRTPPRAAAAGIPPDAVCAGYAAVQGNVRAGLERSPTVLTCCLDPELNRPGAHGGCAESASLILRPANGGTSRSTRCRPEGAWAAEGREWGATAAARADGNDLRAAIQIDPLHSGEDSKNLRRERHSQVLIDHREPARDLLRLVVAVNRRFLDHRLEPGFADPGLDRRLASHLPCRRSHAKSSGSLSERRMSSSYSTATLSPGSP